MILKARALSLRCMGFLADTTGFTAGVCLDGIPKLARHSAFVYEVKNTAFWGGGITFSHLSAHAALRIRLPARHLQPLTSYKAWMKAASHWNAAWGCAPIHAFVL
jgi:hypothetical protein